MEKLTPMVLTQGEVPWNPKPQAHNSPVNDNFYKEVIAAAEADAKAEQEESQILETRQWDEEEARSKQNSCLHGSFGFSRRQDVSCSLSTYL